MVNKVRDTQRLTIGVSFRRSVTDVDSWRLLWSQEGCGVTAGFRVCFGW